MVVSVEAENREEKRVTQGYKPYNPGFDPLFSNTPGHGEAYAPTYWVATAGEPPEDDGPITHDIDVDVAIIGSGYTGLACAIYLARDHGIKATVLEANRVSWGCSTRNGGQAQCASGRLKRSEWIARWGKETAIALHEEICDAMANFKALIEDIDCDAQPGGHLYIAHKPSVMKTLEKEVKIMNEVFHYDAKIIDKATLAANYLDDKEAAGAMLEPEGIGVHAGKLAFGYLKKARALGARVHTSSPVEGWETRDGIHYLKTPGGVVRAKKVAVATGGYGGQKLHKQFKNRLLPVLSNSLVTRPLTEQEIKACHFKTKMVLTDTRVLRHYYRLLPDGRVQIGSRSAISGKHASEKKYEDMLIRDLHRKFPALKGIEIDYSWWGWVDVAHDMMPRITQPDPAESIYCALGYGGNGVMYSAQGGKRMAEMVAGKGEALTLPIFVSALPFPNVFNPKIESELFAPFRRFGQWWLYRWYAFKDEYL